MKISKSFYINPLLEIEIETTSEQLVRFFETKFAGLYSSVIQNKQAWTKIEVREVPRIELTFPQIIRKTGIPELCLFDEHNFVVVKDEKRIKIPFSEIGQSNKLSIIFETGFSLNWLRRYLENLIAYHLLGQGASLYHAACLCRGDYEIIIPAWRGTGKTTLALHLLIDQSFAYKAEDQFVVKETSESYIFTDACNVDHKHLEQFPVIQNKHGSFSFKMRNMTAKFVLPFIPPKGRILTYVRRGLQKVMTPKVFVKLADTIPGFRISTQQPKQRIVLQLFTRENRAKPEIKLVDVNKLIMHTVGGMQYEREDLYTMYCVFVYATGIRNWIIENAVEKETEILSKALSGAECYEIQIGDNWPENYVFITRLLRNTIRMPVD
jgi:hypothetical protein